MEIYPTVGQISSWIEEAAPVSLAEQWDRVGLQTGDWSRRVRKVMTALTLCERVTRQALQQDADMIVVHHPLIFQPLSAIDPYTRVGTLITTLIEKKLALYVAHTNLDAAMGGVNDGLADRLQLVDVEPLLQAPRKTDEVQGRESDYGANPGIGRIGKLNRAMSGKQFANYVMERLSLPNVRVVGNPDKTIEHVAVVGGSGGSFVPQAHRRGADALITGDVDFHDADEALFLDLTIVDAGHFGTEKHMPQDMARLLHGRATKENVSIDIVVAEEADPFTVLHREINDKGRTVRS